MNATVNDLKVVALQKILEYDNRSMKAYRMFSDSKTKQGKKQAKRYWLECEANTDGMRYLYSELFNDSAPVTLRDLEKKIDELTT